MSTNPVMESYAGGLQRDPNFSWVKGQILEEWLRVHNPGEVIQDEFLASRDQLVEGRKAVDGKPFVMPDETTVEQLGIGVPNTAVTFETTEEVMDWLDEPFIMPGNAEAAPTTVSRRYAAVGYENFRRTPSLREEDIPSVFTFTHMEPMSDESTVGQENPGFFACSSCYDPTDEGGAGKYLPSEVTTDDLTCPDPECDGVLIFMSNRHEWLQPGMRYDTDVAPPTEPYRRRSGSPDTTAWLQTERLMNMSCPFWERRR
jgi:hypothetical protein